MVKWLFRVLPIIYMIAIWVMSSHVLGCDRRAP